MAGGPERAFREVEPLLRRLGGTVTHVGENGQGLLLKLAVEAMSASAIGSPMLKAREPGIPLPAAAAADSMLSRAEEMGYGHRDIVGFLQVLAGEPVPEAA